jgi:hypothetical protein
MNFGGVVLLGRSPQVSGSLIAVTPETTDFVSYEIWNYIEEILPVRLEDVSLFRDHKGGQTGLVIAKCAQEVP